MCILLLYYTYTVITILYYYTPVDVRYDFSVSRCEGIILLKLERHHYININTTIID